MSFSADVTGGSNLQYRWDWATARHQPAYSSSADASYSYSSAGRFLVTLTVKNFDDSTTSHQFIQAIHEATRSLRHNAHRASFSTMAKSGTSTLTTSA